MAKFQINWTNQFFGPSPRSIEPVVVASLSAQGELSPKEVLKAAETLNSQFPYASRLNEISQSNIDDPVLLVGQIASDWALGILNEIRGYLHTAGAEKQDRETTVWIAYHHPDLSRQAFQIAVSSLQFILDGIEIKKDLRAELSKFFKVCRRHHPDYQARILMIGAKEMGVPYFSFLQGTKLMQFGWGKKGQIFRENGSNYDGHHGIELAQSKITTKAVLSELGYPTPAYTTISKSDELSAALKTIGYPCVLKPYNRGRGDGVTANIKSQKAARSAFDFARGISDGPIIVEQHLQGADYRLMVINGKMAMAIKREPSSVVGDGRSTIGALIKKLNAGRFENLSKSNYLKPIKDEAVLHAHLASQSVGIADVLPIGKRVTLRSNANRSTGGIATDVTAQLHPEIRHMAEHLAQTLGLWAAGLDYMTTDITQSPKEIPGGFIEINKTPGMCLCVASGVAEAEIGRLSLGVDLGAIPVNLSIVAKSAVEQARDEMANQTAEDGKAWVCGNEIFMGGVALHHMQKQPWDSVYGALRNRSLCELDIICSGEEIQRFGLPVDRFARVEIADPKLPDPWVSLISDLTKSA